MNHKRQLRKQLGTNRSVLRRSGFVTFAAAYAASFLGDQMWFVTLGWAAGQLGSARETALVMAVGSVPRAPLLLVGGAVADRFGPLRTSVASQAARLVLLAGGAIAILLARGAGLPILIGIAFTFGVLDAIHTPALGAVAPSLLPAQDLTGGQGVLQGIQRLTMVLGAPVGGIAVAFGNIPLALCLVAVLFALSWGTLRRLRPAGVPASQQSGARSTSFIKEALDGLRTATANPVVLAILVVMTVLNFGLAGQLNVGVVLLVNKNHWPATGFAMMLSSFALGAALGAFAVTATKRARRPVVAALFWVAAGATSLASLALASRLWVSCMLVAGAGLAFGPASALLMGSLQARTPTSHIARVTALSTFASVGLTPIAYLTFGALADISSIDSAFGAFGGLVLITCGATMCVPVIRTVSTTVERGMAPQPDAQTN